MSTATEIARHLLQIKAIKLSPKAPFTWASGIQSPIYCDNRIVLSYPEVRDYVKAQLVAAAKQFDGVDLIAGVATAGISHGALIADALSLPFAYVRSKAKGHGRQNLIEGRIPEGSNILVIEDLISTGGSCLQAVEALRAEGHTVVGVLAIFTYGFDRADAAFAKAGVPYRTLSDYSHLLDEAVRTDYISPDDLSELQDWRARTGAVKG